MDGCDGVIMQTNKFFPRTLLGASAFMWSLVVTADVMAQGVVGPPVDPRYGQNGGDPGQLVEPPNGQNGIDLGQLLDFGYDTARDISRAATAIAFLFALFFPLSKKWSKKKRIAWRLALVILVPLVVHVIGTFCINNLGGLGGSL